MSTHLKLAIITVQEDSINKLTERKQELKENVGRRPYLEAELEALEADLEERKSLLTEFLRRVS